MSKVGLVVGVAVAIGAICGVNYIKKKVCEENKSTFKEDIKREYSKAKGAIKGINIKGKVSRVVNDGVGKLKAVTDAWEAKENGLASSNIPKTDFEMACEEDTIGKDLEEEDASAWEEEPVEDSLNLWEIANEKDKEDVDDIEDDAFSILDNTKEKVEETVSDEVEWLEDIATKDKVAEESTAKDSEAKEQGIKEEAED